MQNKFKRIFNWQYWPLYLFYLPVFIYVAWLAIRSVNTTFFSLVNPAIKWGGLFSYSKSEILQKLPIESRPIEILFPANCSAKTCLNQVFEKQMSFPLILKPDMGERGKHVALIKDEGKFPEYPLWGMTDIIAQEYIGFPLEIGAFFIRDIQTGRGKITSLMQRKYLSVKGDGKSSVMQLLNKGKGSFIEKVKKLYPDKLDHVPENAEEFIIEPIGNHNRGTLFLDARDKINQDLENVLNELLKDLNGFNYGRLDIKALSWEDLYEGKNFKIIEVNACNSEPAHIYQPGFSLFKAYQSIFWHWKEAWKIARIQSNSGLNSESFADLYLGFKKYLRNTNPQ